MAKITPKRRIKRARITHISLCKRGRNRASVLYKQLSEDRVMFDVETVAKMDDEGLLTCVIVVPGEPFSDGDVMGKEGDDDMGSIRESCHNFLTECIDNGGGVDISHDFQTLDSSQIQICENFMIQKGDPRFKDFEIDGRKADATGGWATVFKIHSEEIKAKYRTGDWNGVSMAGPAIFEDLTKSDFSDDLANSIGKTSTTEIDMDPKEFEKLLSKQAETITTAVAKAVAEAVAAAPTADNTEGKQAEEHPATIEFEGDPANQEDVRKHADKLRLASVDFNDLKSVTKHQASLAKGDSDESEGDSDESEDSPQIAQLRKEMKVASDEISRLKAGESSQSTEGKVTETAKSESSSIRASMARGKASAERLNKRNGRR